MHVRYVIIFAVRG